MDQLPCLIYQNLEDGDLEVRRFEMQIIRRSWKPMERANALDKMRRDLGVQSARELTEYIPMSASAIRNSLSLKEEHSHYSDLWSAHELNESFQVELNSLKRSLCKIGDTDVDEIIDNILQRIIPGNEHKGKIKNSKEIRILRTAFKEVSLYESIIADYLTDFDMTTAELKERMIHSGNTVAIEKITNWYTQKLSTKSSLTDKEGQALDMLVELHRTAQEKAKATV